MKFILGLLLLGGFLSFCWYAHNVTEQSKTKALKAEIERIKQEDQKVAAENVRLFTANAVRVEEIRKALLLVFPANVQQIEAAFAPPKPATTPTALEIDKEKGAK